MAAAAASSRRVIPYTAYMRPEDSNEYREDIRELVLKAITGNLLESAERTTDSEVYTVHTSSGTPWIVKRVIDPREGYSASEASRLGIGPYVPHVHHDGLCRTIIMEAFDHDLTGIEEGSSTDEFKMELVVQSVYRVAQQHLFTGPHGDIKLQNIVVRREPMEVKLIDFPGSGYKFTVEFLAPERALAGMRGENLEDSHIKKADVYSIAMVAFHILTGKVVPTRRGDKPATIRSIYDVRSDQKFITAWIKESVAEASSFSSELSTRIERIFTRALHPVPNCRYTAGEFLSQLISILPKDTKAALELKGCNFTYIIAASQRRDIPSVDDSCCCAVM